MTVFQLLYTIAALEYDVICNPNRRVCAFHLPERPFICGCSYLIIPVFRNHEMESCNVSSKGRKVRPSSVLAFVLSK